MSVCEVQTANVARMHLITMFRNMKVTVEKPMHDGINQYNACVLVVFHDATRFTICCYRLFGCCISDICIRKNLIMLHKSM